MPRNVTFHNVEVHFAVDGDDGAVFARLFNRYIQAWARRYEEECARAERSGNDRRIGDAGGRR